MARFEHNGSELEDVNIQRLRLRSRKAEEPDCRHFLKPNVDVCVQYSHLSKKKRSKGELPKGRCDAKITSILRRPHKPDCECSFFVSFYGRGDLNEKKRKRVLDRETRAVKISHLFILQKPCIMTNENNQAHDKPYDDCPSIRVSKLFNAAACSEVAWLVVVSTLRGMIFDIRITQNRIAYLVLNRDGRRFGYESESTGFNNSSTDDQVNETDFGSLHGVKEICFQMKDGVMHGQVQNVDIVELAKPGFYEKEGDLDALDPFYPMEEVNSESTEFIGLRRSQRQKNYPDRFVSFDLPFDKKGWTANPRTSSVDIWEKKEIPCSDHPLYCLVEDDESSQNSPKKMKHDDTTMATGSPGSDHSQNQKRHSKSLLSKSITSTVSRESMKKGEPSCKIMENDYMLPRNDPNKIDGMDIVRKRSSQNQKEEDSCYSENIRKHSESQCTVTTQTENPSVGRNDSDNGEIRSISPSQKVGSGRLQKGLKEKVRSSFKVRQCIQNSFSKKRSSGMNSLGVNFTRLRKKRKKMNSFGTLEHGPNLECLMKSIDLAEKKKPPPVISQWELHNKSNPIKFSVWPSDSDNDRKSLEHEDLWKEMEEALALSSFNAALQEMKMGDSNSCVGAKETEHLCKHEYFLDEQIGIICRICKCVKTEIQYVPPLFDSYTIGKRKQHIDKVLEADEILDVFTMPCNGTVLREAHKLEEYGNVWALVPELERKLHTHQKKAFEFIWRNIAGTLNPKDMDCGSNQTGGCVISHSPGTGKTCLIISFLKSYLALFPGSRPLILVPKVTLYTWSKEFEKWNADVPLYIVHAWRDYERKGNVREKSGNNRKLPRRIAHITDCLKKIHTWHEYPSVLLMSYPTFFCITRERCEYKKKMSGVLLNNTGLLILDEGHKPRSNSSKLRKALMAVKTSKRILLSGTLFQNNFEEYFNTLYLARPSFVFEVLMEFREVQVANCGMGSPDMERRNERVARGFFVDEIARRIDSGIKQERQRGLQKLRKITSNFIDTYEGGVLESLPGLQTYTIMIKPTLMQQPILNNLQMAIERSKVFSLELEFLITVASIHPWLLKTMGCGRKYLTEAEIGGLSCHPEQGSKVEFIVDLVQLCAIKKEKVLIFSKYIEPINFLVEIFELKFGWQVGNEVLVLQGNQDLYERGVVIEEFNKVGGSAKVLLASTSACSEGINLTGASRLVLLDAEWNPSKIKQAIARAFRLGQERMVYVYKLVALGTIEEDKYRKTVWKEWLSRLVFEGGKAEESTHRQAEHIEDDMLRAMVGQDQGRRLQMVTQESDKQVLGARFEDQVV
ncbi:SNF2 domain-containing protein CLASSY 1 isoform X2 [Amborella trichopoda]|nr:SNF2 domain-containing protein CLASSY 1 isoform X2 [Amborella trichopoda]|eukprot:XP_011626997.1 SNF2 domain-containing protein CLASSY 1 isoform X2 [Amborella trichopoda]